GAPPPGPAPAHHSPRPEFARPPRRGGAPDRAGGSREPGPGRRTGGAGVAGRARGGRPCRGCPPARPRGSARGAGHHVPRPRTDRPRTGTDAPGGPPPGPRGRWWAGALRGAPPDARGRDRRLRTAADGLTMARRSEATLLFDALALEGGLFPPEWLAKVAALEAPAQAPADYGIKKGLELRDEITRYWRIAEALWSEFCAARAQPGHDP